MRRVVLLAVLALALPTAALADTLDYASIGTIGVDTTVTGSAVAGGTISIVAPLTQIKDLTTATILPGTPNGTVAVTTGTLVATAIPGIFTFSGGSITITNNGSTLFSGTFGTGNTVMDLGNGHFSMTAVTVGGVAVTTQLDFAGGISGDTIVTPEPGTLGLLGTGLVGLAGIVRRKMRG